MADLELPEDDARELLALERTIRRADGFALAFARINSLSRRRELADDLRQRLTGDVRVVEVDVPPETTDLEWLLAERYEAERGDGKVAFFVYGIERALSSVRERSGFLPVLNYKRENLQRAVPAPVVLWMPEFALRLVALGAPDTWAWRSGVFEFMSPRKETEQTWQGLLQSGSDDEYARMTPAERRVRVETLQGLYHDYSERDDSNAEGQVATRANLADRLGRLYADLADYDTAQEWAERAVTLSKKVFGPDHLNTITSVSNLATLLQARGDTKSAELLKRRALAGCEATLGPDHPHTLTAVNNLAYSLSAGGDLDGAEPLYRRALAAREEALGPDHQDTLASVNNLAFLLQTRGDLDSAESLYRRVLTGREAELGPYHQDTLVSVSNLASLLYARGDLDSAELLERRALAGREAALGPDHPDTILSVNNLAILLYARGDLDSAELLGRRALAGREAVFGFDHPKNKLYRSFLGSILIAKVTRASGDE